MTLLMRDRENVEKGRVEGRTEGRAEGRTEGYISSIRLCRKFHMTKEATLEELKQDFSLSDAEARKVLEKYWNDERK